MILSFPITLKIQKNTFLNKILGLEPVKGVVYQYWDFIKENLEKFFGDFPETPFEDLLNGTNKELFAYAILYMSSRMYGISQQEIIDAFPLGDSSNYAHILKKIRDLTSKLDISLPYENSEKIIKDLFKIVHNEYQLLDSDEFEKLLSYLDEIELDFSNPRLANTALDYVKYEYKIYARMMKKKVPNLGKKKYTSKIYQVIRRSIYEHHRKDSHLASENERFLMDTMEKIIRNHHFEPTARKKLKEMIHETGEEIFARALDELVEDNIVQYQTKHPIGFILSKAKKEIKIGSDPDLEKCKNKIITLLRKERVVGTFDKKKPTTVFENWYKNKFPNWESLNYYQLVAILSYFVESYNPNFSLSEMEDLSGISSSSIYSNKKKLPTEDLEPLFSGESFHLFAFDINHLINTMRTQLPPTLRPIPFIVEKIQILLAQSDNYIALFFASSYYGKVKQYFPESDQNRWYIERRMKIQKNGKKQIQDVDRVLQRDCRDFLKEHKDQIDGFTLASGDQDADIVVKTANELKIPVRIAVVKRKSHLSRYLESFADEIIEFVQIKGDIKKNRQNGLYVIFNEISNLVNSLGEEPGIQEISKNLCYKCFENKLNLKKKNPKGYAAAAVYLASKKLNRKVTQHTISEATGLTVSTISSRIKEMKSALKNATAL